MLQYHSFLFFIAICGAVGCSRDSTTAASKESDSTTPTQRASSQSNEDELVITKTERPKTKSKPLVVVDASGNPIAQATIRGTALSMGGPTFFSDKNGEANLPFAIQPIRWVTVSKQGFRTSAMIDVEQPRPIRIILEAGEDNAVEPTSVPIGTFDASLEGRDN